MTYSLLHTLSVAALLLDVPALVEEVDVQPSAARASRAVIAAPDAAANMLGGAAAQVHALAVDPHDRRRLAFQLGT